MPETALEIAAKYLKQFDQIDPKYRPMREAALKSIKNVFYRLRPSARRDVIVNDLEKWLSYLTWPVTGAR